MTDCDRRPDADLPYLCDAICACCAEPYQRGEYPDHDMCAICLEDAREYDAANELLDAAEE